MAEPATTQTTTRLPTSGFEIPPDMKKRLVERFDTDKDGTLGTTEIDAAAKRIRQETSVLNDATKEHLKKQGATLSDLEFGKQFATDLGLKIEDKSAVEFAKAYREGLNSEPDKELLAEREKARKAAGKGKDEKPWWEALIGFIMEMFGMKKEEKPETPTADAAAPQTTPPADKADETPKSLGAAAMADIAKVREAFRKSEIAYTNSPEAARVQVQTAAVATPGGTASAR